MQKIIDKKNPKDFAGALEIGIEILEKREKSQLPDIFLENLKQQKTPNDWNKFSEETLSHVIIKYLSPELKYDAGDTKHTHLESAESRLRFIIEAGTNAKGRLQSHDNYYKIMSNVANYYRDNQQPEIVQEISNFQGRRVRGLKVRGSERLDRSAESSKTIG